MNEPSWESMKMIHGGYLQTKCGQRKKNELEDFIMNLKLLQLYLLLRCPNENMRKKNSHTDQRVLHSRGASCHHNSCIATFISYNRMITLLENLIISICKWWNDRKFKKRILAYKLSYETQRIQTKNHSERLSDV